MSEGIMKLVVSYENKELGVTEFRIREQTMGCGEFPVDYEHLGESTYDYMQDIDDVMLQLSSCDRPEIRCEYNEDEELARVYFFLRGMDIPRHNDKMRINTDLFDKYVAPAVLGFNQLHSKNSIDMEDVVIPEGDYDG